MEATERAVLATFAEKSGESRGRRYSEPSHAYRTEFQRDRARIIHLRVVQLLETPYPNFPGLNLTFEVREGLRKHEPAFKTPDGETYHCTSLEAQVADLADEITYYSHDLDDAVDFEILSPAQLEENEVWRKSHRAVLARYGGGQDPELHKLIIRDIIDHEVHDLVTTSAKSIAEAGVQSADDV